MTSSAPVFVTGGNGFVGSRLVHALVAAGRSVRCLLRETSDVSRLGGVAYERVAGDVRDLDSLRKGMEGCVGVFHLASLSSWTDIESPQMIDVGVGGTRNVLEAAKAAGKLRTVFMSSAVAVNGSKTPEVFNERSQNTLPLDRFTYVRAKVQAEQLCKRACDDGVPVVIVNPTEVYGANDTGFVTAGNLLDFHKSDPVLVCSGGTSVVHVDDVAAGTLAAFDKGRVGERYILGGDNLSVIELARVSLEILGEQKKRVLTVPNRLLRVAAKTAQALHLPFPINPSVVPYATLYWFMDNAKARDELGLTFRSPREALVPAFAWLRSAGHLR